MGTRAESDLQELALKTLETGRLGDLDDDEYIGWLEHEVKRFRARESYVRALAGDCEDMMMPPESWHQLVDFEQDSGEW